MRRFCLGCGRQIRLLPVFVFVLAAGATADAEERRPAGKCVSETAALVRREGLKQPWRIVAKDEELQSGDVLVGGRDAVIDSANGGVRLSIMGDMDGTSPFPILETAVVLHSSKDADLDFTLDRGRVDLVNRKESGSARIRVQVRDKTGEIILPEPGNRVAIEIYGRWLRGTRFNKNPKPGEGPALALVILALKGEVELKGKDKEFTLKAPPGPALLMTDSLDATVLAPQQLGKLPVWAEPTGATEKAKRVKAVLAKFRRLAVEKSINEAIDELLHSDIESERRAAIVLMGAMDDLKRLAAAVTSAQHADVWDQGVIVLRHWIGRGPGQDLKLYNGMVQEAKVPPREAAIVLDLLHSFGDEDLANPETYECLIDFMESDRVAIRGLAHWHLYRLVPAGQKIKYHPLASKEDRDRAVQEWRTLIPSGKLPPKTNPEH